MTRMKNVVLLAGSLLITNTLMALEEPTYKVIEKYDDIEIRAYNPYIVAEMEISADFEEAGNKAFSALAGYIGGENVSQESIEMTAPVNQEKLAKQSTEIEMTAPVEQETLESGKYRVSFVMPGRFTMATLPKPKDVRIQLREVPEKKVAVIRYSGTWSKNNYEENKSRLLAFIGEKGYEIIGSPLWARYDPPFMPWFLRRNEIMIGIR
jgi:effector-binding domain-containing protein